MSKKHIFNSPDSDNLVLKSLRGAVSLNPSLRLHEPSKTVCLANHHDASSANVSVISGGGAGHEPAHAGYTGRGMLTASVSGDIFSSPSAWQILQALRFAIIPGSELSDQDGSTLSTGRRKDVLVIINNYTGDRLNFGLAIEKAKGKFEGVGIESIVVADDVSLLPSSSLSSASNGVVHAQQGLVGPRGLAGNIIVCKVMGALAEHGATLKEMKLVGDAVVGSLASVGVALEHCHVPGRSVETSNGEIPGDECEVGLGLHNESGVRRRKLGFDDGRAGGLVREMLAMIMGSREGGFVTGFEPAAGATSLDEVVLFMNNLGGMSQLEMGALLDETLYQLGNEYKLYPRRIYLAPFMTSLNAPGFSISILNISNIHRIVSGNATDDGFVTSRSVSILELLDGPTDTAAWKGFQASNWPASPTPSASAHSLRPRAASEIGSHEQQSSPASSLSCSKVEKAIIAACERVIQVKDELTRYDEVLGDGDCGETFARGANAILGQLGAHGSPLRASLSPQPANAVWQAHGTISIIAEVAEGTMGGTMGALIAIFLTALASSLRDIPSSPPSGPTLRQWATSLFASLTTLSRYTPARPGDRTIIDSLQPFCEALLNLTELGSTTERTSHEESDVRTRNILLKAVHATRQGAEGTRKLRPRLGRAAYVVGSEVGELPPDPGAHGVLVLVEGLCSVWFDS